MANIKFSQFSIGNNLIVGDTVVGLRSGANTKFTFPGTGINDASNNPMLAWSSPGASAVNYLAFSSAITANNPSITPDGTDSDIGLTLTSKGNGDINLDPAGTGICTVQSSVRFANATAIQTGKTNADTVLFQAYDVDNTTYTTFATLTAGNNPSFAITVTSLTLTTPLDVASGGTGTATAFTEGSVVFAGASGVYTQDNANFFWDDTNNRLGIGNAAPTVELEVTGTVAANALACSSFLDSGGQQVITFTNSLSSINYFNFAAVNTLNKPIFSATGGDTNIGMILACKGNGVFQMASTSVTPIQFNSGTAQQHTANFEFADTAGTQNITFPDGDGTVAFTCSIYMPWSTVTISTQAAATNNGYVCNYVGTVTVTLPATCAVGDVVAVEGLASGGGWTLTANTGQTIQIGQSETVSGGVLSSVHTQDNVYVTCIVANTTWRVRSTNSMGLIVI